jgi:hypothetical protein
VNEEEMKELSWPIKEGIRRLRERRMLDWIYYEN